MRAGGWGRRAAVAAAVVAAAACSVAQKKAAVEATTGDAGRRRELFEATLRVLDENPAYVDEFFELARDHRATLGRFLRNSARALDERWLAEITAEELVRAPAGLRQVMVATVDAAGDRPEARAALLGSMRDRAHALARLLLSDPDTMEELMGAVAAEGSESALERLRSALRGAAGKG
jgi:hypothetical protein